MTSTIKIPTTNQIGKGTVSIGVTTDGIRLARAKDGPVLDLDLMAMVEQLRLLSTWSDGCNSRTPVKYGNFPMILKVMKAGARLQSARSTVLIQVLSSQFRVRTLDEIFESSAGQALSLDPDLEHEIEAVKENAILVTIPWPQDFSIVRKEPVGRMDSLCSIKDPIEAAARPESDAA